MNKFGKTISTNEKPTTDLITKSNELMGKETLTRKEIIELTEL